VVLALGYELLLAWLAEVAPPGTASMTAGEAPPAAAEDGDAAG
jgi:hypothetical protein